MFYALFLSPHESYSLNVICAVSVMENFSRIASFVKDYIPKKHGRDAWDSNPAPQQWKAQSNLFRNDSSLLDLGPLLIRFFE